MKYIYVYICTVQSIFAFDNKYIKNNFSFFQIKSLLLVFGQNISAGERWCINLDLASKGVIKYFCYSLCSPRDYLLLIKLLFPERFVIFLNTI